MNETQYQELLKTAPEDHFSDEFIQFLKDNNDVVEQLGNWLVIRNKKYWTPLNDWVTAFYVGSKNKVDSEIYGTQELIHLHHYKKREWLIKAPHKRSVNLFHVHMYNK